MIYSRLAFCLLVCFSLCFFVRRPVGGLMNKKGMELGGRRRAEGGQEYVA